MINRLMDRYMIKRKYIQMPIETRWFLVYSKYLRIYCKILPTVTIFEVFIRANLFFNFYIYILTVLVFVFRKRKSFFF